MSKSVIVVGAINLDLVVVAPTLPGPGETVVGDGMQTFGGGKGANAAVAASRAGAATYLIAAVGSDDNAKAALSQLNADHVDVSGVAVLEGEPTGVALIIVDQHGENQIAVGLGANGALSVDHVRNVLRQRLPQAGCVLVSTEIPAAVVAAAVEAATKAGVACILNPAPVLPALVALLSLGPIVTPNETELLGLANLLNVSGETNEAGEAIAALSRHPVIVTQGADGIRIFGVGSVAVHIAAAATVVRDTTGAGDTFNGVLAAQLASGEDLSVAARKAVVAASLSVGEVGARGGMPTTAEIEAAYTALGGRDAGPV